MPSGASYFGTYEWLMRRMSSAEKGRHELSVPRILFAGGMAGVVNWLVILPPDVAKSRIQTAPPGMYRHVGSAFMELVSSICSMSTHTDTDTLTHSTQTRTRSHTAHRHEHAHTQHTDTNTLTHSTQTRTHSHTAHRHGHAHTYCAYTHTH